MLVDGIDADQLEGLAIEALKAENTLAGNRVFSWEDWPTDPKLFPIVLVSTPRDRKAAIGPGIVPQFNTTITLVVMARVVAISHQEASAALRTLRRQIEDAILCQPSISQFVQRFATVDTQIVVTAEAKNHIGELGMTFEIEVYQLFAYSGGDPLTNVTTTIAPAGDPGPTVPLVISSSTPSP